MPEVAKTAEKDHYLADLECVAQRSAPGWVTRIREGGAARFSELDFPNRRVEEWRFTNINPVVRTPFRSLFEPAPHTLTAKQVVPFLYSEEGWTELVFIDGFFAKELSRLGELPQGVHAGSLMEAIGTGDETLERHLDRYAGGNGNIFNALNSAFLLDGAFVHIPPNVVLSHPIHLVFVTSAREENTAAYPRNLVVVQALSQATLIENYVSLAGETRYLNDEVTEIVLEEGARLHRHKVVQESAQGYSLATTKVRQSRDSAFTSHVMTLGGRIVRNELSSVLDGENAECSLNGLYLIDGKQLVDNATSIEHAKPHCSSWIGYKGVLDGRSHGVFTGKIHVRPGAQKTDSKQLNNSLILSDRATIDTKPILEIFADDVKCTHGATVGAPPRELVFYFQSRGISEKKARGLLTYGFAGKVVNQIEVTQLRDRLDKFVFDKYCPQ